MVFGFGKKEQIIEKEVIKEVYRTPEKKKRKKSGSSLAVREKAV